MELVIRHSDLMSDAFKTYPTTIARENWTISDTKSTKKRIVLEAGRYSIQFDEADELSIIVCKLNKNGIGSYSFSKSDPTNAMRHLHEWIEEGSDNEDEDVVEDNDDVDYANECELMLKDVESGNVEEIKNCVVVRRFRSIDNIKEVW